MIHLPHPAIAHLPVATVLVICLHNLFSLPATTPTKGLGYFLNFFMQYKFLNHCHTSYRLAYEDGSERSKTLAFKLPTTQTKTYNT
jgi:hypothetical protein